MEMAMLNEVRDTFAPAQLATASLNFGVGRSRSFCVKSTIWEERPPLKIFASCLVLGEFLKFNSISLFVFFGEFYRVSLNPVFQPVACGAPLTRPGGRATLSCSPRPTISDR
jgi:hypothetical protein